MAGEIVWRPDAETIANSRLTAFLKHVGLADYDALVAKADAEPAWFWDTVIKWLDVRFERPYDTVLDLSDGLPWPKWCVGGTTNFTLNCLDRHRGTPVEDATAIVWESETGETRAWSYRELDAEACRLAEGLKQLGLGPGDAIGIYMPMLPETAAAFFAIARIGGVAVPLFSGFGAEAIATRLNDASAKAVICADGTRRRGADVPLKPVLDQAAAEVPTLQHVVVLRSRGNDLDWHEGRDRWWHDVVAGQPDRGDPEIVPAETPVLLVFTSGTTGKPKGTVGTHCGFPIKIAIDFTLCLDFKASDRLMWLTDFGWVVGPMITVAVTMAGGSLLMAEGVPDYPEKGRMWKLAQDHDVTVLGTAPTSIRTLMRNGVEEVEKYDLSSLRTIVSTGEPWTDEAWAWCFENVGKGRIPLLNWTGGTEIGGGILCGTMHHALKSCAFGGPVPGMGADIVDEQGRSVPSGQVGELVLRRPSIGLSRGVWQDRERYLETYWSMFGDMWRQGDWASRDDDGMWYVHGRSDDTLKLAGKRTGPAEIEGLVMATGKVSETAAIGIPDPIAGQAVMCVCVPAPGVAVDAALEAEIADAVAAGLGKPFRPKRLLFVDDLPKTRNMKILRRVVRAVVQGDAPGDLTALVNPEAIDALREKARAS